MNGRTKRAALALGIGVLGLLLGGPVVLAQPDADTAKPPPDPIALELDTVGKMLSNAQAKLNRGAVGVETSGTGEVLTPARVCCSGNLQHIDDGLKKIRGLVRENGVCFERRRDREGVEIVNLVNQDLRALESAVDLFATATRPGDTQGALSGCTRAYLNLKRSLATMKSKDCSDGS